ncbi:MAG: ABC transporter permease [Rhizomicrobium sp.]
MNLRLPARTRRQTALQTAMNRAGQGQKLRALLMIAPVLLFLLANFVAPISSMLFQGVHDTALAALWPQTAHDLRRWDGAQMPPPELVKNFVQELRDTHNPAAVSELANRLNYDTVGMRSLVMHTLRHREVLDDAAPTASLLRIDPRWGDRDVWVVMKHAVGPLTSFYMLAAVDRRLDADGQVQFNPQQAIFIPVLLRTLWISAVVTILCLLLGFPVAYLLVGVPDRQANMLLILILLPFWTSILVRTTAWVVLLQSHGVINDALSGAGIVAHPLALIYNRVGVYIAMTYVLLPYAILPVYAVMKGIPRSPLRAAVSLGATPARVFWTVFAPQALPGVLAGALIVFVLALGYYVTPALVGGARDQMISYFIAYYTNQSLNWGMASALSIILLAATLVLVQFCARIVGNRAVLWRA